MSRKPIQYIIEVKQWWDKVNGNSYFSGRIYDLTMDLLYVCPFQYGDTSHSKDVAINAIWEAHNDYRKTSDVKDPNHVNKHDIHRMCYFNHTDDLKKWCKQHGETPLWYEMERMAHHMSEE